MICFLTTVHCYNEQNWTWIPPRCYFWQEDDQIYGRQDRPFSTKFESEPLYQWYAKDKIIRNNRQLSTSDVSGSGDDTESSTDESVSGELVHGLVVDL